MPSCRRHALSRRRFRRSRLATICAPSPSCTGASSRAGRTGATGSATISVHSIGPLNSWYFFFARSPVAWASSASPHSRLALQPGTARRSASPSSRYSAGSAARRRSYGGLQTTRPGASPSLPRTRESMDASPPSSGAPGFPPSRERGASASRDTGATCQSTSPASPASTSLSRAAAIARGSMSRPANTGRSAARPADSRVRASSSWRCHSASSKPSQREGGKPPWRRSPGATSAAISAASITRVPLPHMGSSSPPPAAYTRGQRPRSSTPAARFSFSGASPWWARQPRRCNGPPPRSTDSTARPLRTTRFRRRSGCPGSTSGRAPVAWRITSTTASLARCVA